MTSTLFCTNTNVIVDSFYGLSLLTSFKKCLSLSSGYFKQNILIYTRYVTVLLVDGLQYLNKFETKHKSTPPNNIMSK